MVLVHVAGVFQICYDDGAFVPCTSIFKYPQVAFYGQHIGLSLKSMNIRDD